MTAKCPKCLQELQGPYHPACNAIDWKKADELGWKAMENGRKMFEMLGIHTEIYHFSGCTCERCKAERQK